MNRVSLRTAGVLFACLLALPSWAGQLLFAVSEGTSNANDAIFIKSKYTPLAEYLVAASGEKIVLETPKILASIERNLKNRRYDLMLVHPSHLSARAMRDQGYRLLAVANGDAKVHFIVRGDSKLKSLADIKGHSISVPSSVPISVPISVSIAMPDPLSYPTQLALAVLRDQGINPSQENIRYMDQQDAVSMAVDTGISDVGVVMSYSKPGKDWLKTGGRYLYTKGSLPFWSIIVSSNVPPQTVENLKRALLALNGPSKNSSLLAHLGISGLNEGKPQIYLDMLEWLEGKPPAQIARAM